MVTSGTPSQYAVSAAEGTPHLTINREATIDLDSSNAFEGPEKLLEVWFAPAADQLPVSAAPGGLKAVSAEVWKEMLDIVNCKVLSIVEADNVDAYLLSESSMFVFHHKVILKTCGTTTLLWGLPRLLEIAAASAGFPHEPVSCLKGMPAAASPYRVFYSRKNFLFPDRQRGPHRSWNDEVCYLDRMFLGGSAYMVGKMNGDHWYLYLTTPNAALTPPATPPKSDDGMTETREISYPGEMGCGKSPDDETLEILMTDLDPENAKQFYLENASAVAEGQYFQRAHQARQEAAESLGDLGGRLAVQLPTGGAFSAAEEVDVFSNTSSEGMITPDGDEGFPEELCTEGHALGTVVSEACGLSDVYPTSKYPDARVDAYLFTPCGFSANAVIPAPDQKGAAHYFTVHVTPEPECSYASFETNVPGGQSGRETCDVIEHVVSIFKPGRFSVTLFEAKNNSLELSQLGLFGDIVTDPKAESGRRRSAKMECIKGYRRLERIVHNFDDYDLVFRYYERNDWTGGAPRVGEMLL